MGTCVKKGTINCGHYRTDYNCDGNPRCSWDKHSPSNHPDRYHGACKSHVQHEEDTITKEQYAQHIINVKKEELQQHYASINFVAFDDLLKVNAQNKMLNRCKMTNDGYYNKSIDELDTNKRMLVQNASNDKYCTDWNRKPKHGQFTHHCQHK
jgi:hypothetical protein